MSPAAEIYGQKKEQMRYTAALPLSLRQRFPVQRGAIKWRREQETHRNPKSGTSYHGREECSSHSQLVLPPPVFLLADPSEIQREVAGAVPLTHTWRSHVTIFSISKAGHGV